MMFLIVSVVFLSCSVVAQEAVTKLITYQGVETDDFTTDDFFYQCVDFDETGAPVFMRGTLGGTLFMEGAFNADADRFFVDW